jgi:hypothetical protein
MDGMHTSTTQAYGIADTYRGIGGGAHACLDRSGISMRQRALMKILQWAVWFSSFDLHFPKQ